MDYKLGLILNYKKEVVLKMTPTERLDVIETIYLMKKHNQFAKKIGLIDNTKCINISNERRSYDGSNISTDNDIRFW